MRTTLHVHTFTGSPARAVSFSKHCQTSPPSPPPSHSFPKAFVRTLLLPLFSFVRLHLLPSLYKLFPLLLSTTPDLKDVLQCFHEGSQCRTLKNKQIGSRDKMANYSPSTFCRIFGRMFSANIPLTPLRQMCHRCCFRITERKWIRGL